LLETLLSRFGVETTFIDGTQPQNWADAVRPETTLFYLESPNSVTFELQDIEAVASIAKEHGISSVLDNSYASPLNQNPIKMGVDIVVHTASKYLSGHSDVVAGVLCSSQKRIESIFHSEFMTLGGIISPFEAWLMIRGLRTLQIRLERSASSTKKVVEFFEAHPKVDKVIYPHSPSHPQYELALKQQKNRSGQFTVVLKAKSSESVSGFCDRLERFLLACSWGGFESLVFPLCVLRDSENYSGSKRPWNMVRFYIGLEEPDVLIEDLAQALDGLE